MTSYLRLAAKIRLHILSLECSMYQERCQKIVVGYNHFERPAKQMPYFFTILNPLLFSTDLDLKRWDFELQGSYRVLNSWKSLVILPTNFPDLEKDWKCGKKVFSFFFQSYNKCFTSEFFFFVLVMSYSIWPFFCCIFALHHEKSFVLAFLRSVLIIWKRKLLFWNKVWKKSWILYSNLCTNSGNTKCFKSIM